MMIRSAVSAAAFAVLLTSTSAIAQETKSPRLQARLPRAVIDQPADLPSSPLLTTQGEAFFTGKTPRLIGNQAHPNSKVIRSFEALGDYDVRLFGRALVSSAFGIGGGALGDADATALLTGELARRAEADGYPTAELRGGTAPGKTSCSDHTPASR